MRDGYQTGNIIQIFIMDTLFVRGTGKSLREFMMNKHQWDAAEYSKYYDLYMKAIASSDAKAALASLNPGQRSDPMEWIVDGKTFTLRQGDIYMNVEGLFMYLYNPQVFMYMFRKGRSAEIWLEVHQVVQKGFYVGNIFDMPIVTAEQRASLTQA